jgi:hypothetical protein
MAKILTERDNYQGKLDDIKESGSIEKQSLLPDPPKKSKILFERKDNRPVVPEKYTVPQGGSPGLGESIFDESVLELPADYYDLPFESQQQIRDSELREQRAQNQPGYLKAGAFIPRVIAKTGLEFIKGIGYVSAVPLAIAEGDLNAVVDNMFVNELNNIDEGIKEAIPVYVRREIENGGFWRQIWSPEFVGGELADGIGFLASSMLTGGVAGAATKSLGGLAKAAGFAKLAKLEGANRLGTVAFAQSFVESAAETDGAIREFDQYWEQYQQPDGTYLVQNEDGTTTPYTPEEVAEQRRNLGIQSMTMNMLFTFGPNLITGKAILGLSGKSKNIFDELGVNTAVKGKGYQEAFQSMRDGIQKASTRKALLGQVLKEGAKGSAAEGWQEASQFAIQEYGKAQSRMQTDKNLFDGMIDGYIDAFTTVEGQKSIFLGALLGLGPGLKNGFDSRRAQIAQASKLTELMETNLIDLKNKVESYYAKNEDGTLKKIGEDFVLDTEKIQNELLSQMKDASTEYLLAHAKQHGDTLAAKSILNHLLIEKSLPFFQIEGGEQILTQHIAQLSEVLESDSKLMGFKSKEEYVDHIKKVAEAAKKNYDVIKETGPRYFGLDIAKVSENLTRQEQQQGLENFYNQMEAQGALWASLIDLNKAEFSSTREKVQAIEAAAENAYREKVKEPKEDATMEEKLSALPDATRQTQLWKNYQQQIATIEKNLKTLDENYKALFNKKEQQKALEFFIKKAEDKKETQQKFEEEVKNTKEFKERLIQNLMQNGYGETKGAVLNGMEDVGVALQDKDGNKYAIKKVADQEDNQKYMIIPMTEQGQYDFENAVDLTLEELKSRGLDENSILSAKEYKNWRKINRAEERARQYEERILEMQLLYQGKRERLEEEMSERAEKMRQVEAEIQYWLTQDEIPVSSIVRDLAVLEEERAKIANDLESRYLELERIEQSIQLLIDIQAELLQGIEEGYQQIFTLRLKALEQEMKDGEFPIKFENLDALQKSTVLQIAELEQQQEDLQDIINQLSEMLEQRFEFKDAIRNGDIERILKFIQANRPFILENYPELADFTRDSFPRGYVKNLLDLADLSILMFDPEIRGDFLRTLTDAMNPIAADLIEYRQEFLAVSKRLKELNKKRQKINDYIIEKETLQYIIGKQRLIERKERLGELVSFPKKQNRAEKRRIEQDGTSSISPIGSGPLKANPQSTITNVYTDATMKDVQPNPKKLAQAVQWSKAMMNINLSELSNYSLRVVNNQQLSAFNVVPPVEDTDALYTILYKNGEVVTGENGEPVFAGVAKPETYFRADGTQTLRLSDNENMILLEKRRKSISAEKPYVLDNASYTSYEDAREAVINKIERDYTDWRDSLLSAANRGEQIYFGVDHVSRGFVPAENIGDSKNKITSVFNVKNLVIADTSKRIGKKIIGLEDGKVYAELENGQLQRVLNRTIGSLTQGERTKMLNTIISFLAMAKYIGPNYNIDFPMKPGKDGKVKYTIPLFGHKGDPGILDHFISWNTKEANKAWNISLWTSRKTKEKFIRFTQGLNAKGDPIVTDFPVNALFNEKGGVKTSNDPTLASLVNFLNYKYLNVIDRGSRMTDKMPVPTGWYFDKTLNSPVVEYKMVPNYQEYVIDKYLYTEVKPPSENQRLPQFVNQYAEFGKRLDGPTPPKPVQTEKEPTASRPAPNAGLSLATFAKKTQAEKPKSVEDAAPSLAAYAKKSDDLDAISDEMKAALAESAVTTSEQPAQQPTEEQQQCAGPMFSTKRKLGR